MSGSDFVLRCSQKFHKYPRKIFRGGNKFYGIIREKLLCRIPPIIVKRGKTVIRSTQNPNATILMVILIVNIHTSHALQDHQLISVKKQVA